MRCGLCQQDVERFVESHIIPKAMMIDGLKDGERMAVFGTAGHPKKSPTGVWSKIVCLKCEQSFGPDDEYLIDVYRRLHTFPKALEGEATHLAEVDPKRLNRSILSIVYRGHLSNHTMFKALQLGPHADALRIFLLSQSFNIPPDFSIVLRHLTMPVGETVLGPIREKYDGVNVYRLFLPKITALVRVDKRPFQQPFKSLELGAMHEAYAMRFEKFTQSEMRVLANLLQANSGRMEGALGIKYRER